MDKVRQGRQAGSLDTEITPAMKQAGAEILLDFDWGYSDPNEFAARIYAAMSASRMSRS
jgi:hypothetical protein